MTTGPLAKHLVLDDFLPPDLHSALLQYALSHQEQFAPTAIRSATKGVVNTQVRQSLLCENYLGPLELPFLDQVHARFADLCAAAGVAPFAIARSETELVAHGDGHFYRPHLDTLTQQSRETAKTDRVLSLVYYFHRQPKGFGGGELALYRFGGGPEAMIEPRDNRLAVFAAMVPHEVLPIACPSGDFADYRFAVNCWLHRARDQYPSA